MSAELTDPKAEAASKMLAFKQLGYTSKEIAAYFHLSTAQVRRIITDENKRDKLAEAAKDFVHTQLLPKVLSNIDSALNKDESAEISLKIADKLGILDGSAASQPPRDSATSTFEEYRLSVLRKRVNNPSQETLDAAGRDSSVIDAEIAPAVALPSHERGGEGDEDHGAESE